MLRKRFYLVILSALILQQLFSASYLEEGEKLFLENKPVEAKSLLEEALKIDPTNEKIYHYLSLIYEQLGDPGASYALLKKGITYAVSMKFAFYYNMANNLFTQEQNTLADEMYTRAIAEKDNNPDPYLNRGNARIKIENYSGALTDYRKYLQLYPGSPKRPQVEALIKALTEMADEQNRLLREQQERDKNLLNLLESLQNAEDNTKNISEGTEKLNQSYEEEDILE